VNEAFLGVDIGGTQTKLALVFVGGETRLLDGIPTQARSGPGEFFKRLHAQLAAVLPDEQPVAAGLSVAGLVDRAEQLAAAPNLGAFVGAGLREEWEARFEIPLRCIENDVQCAMYGELMAGAAQGQSYAAMLSLGTGVGGGIVVDGRLYRGARGLGGELGHIILDPNGPACACGGRGHVESYLSSAAIVEAARDAFADCPADLSVEEISRRAHAGDADARELLRDRGYYLGLACASLAHALNPGAIIIGGGVAGCGEYLLEPARQTLRERTMAASLVELELVPAKLGAASAAIGAAHLAKDAPAIGVR
jgi:glucokinase